MLALEAVFDGKPKLAMIYLLITQIIDGIDGPIARQYDVKSTVPKIDGYVLDQKLVGQEDANQCVDHNYKEPGVF